MDHRTKHLKADLAAHLHKMEMHVPFDPAQRQRKVEAFVERGRARRKRALPLLAASLVALVAAWLVAWQTWDVIKATSSYSPIVLSLVLGLISIAPLKPLYDALASDRYLEECAELRIQPHLLSADGYGHINQLVLEQPTLAPFVMKWIEATGGTLSRAEEDLLFDADDLMHEVALFGDAETAAAELRQNLRANAAGADEEARRQYAATIPVITHESAQ